MRKNLPALHHLFSAVPNTRNSPAQHPRRALRTTHSPFFFRCPFYHTAYLSTTTVQSRSPSRVSCMRQTLPCTSLPARPSRSHPEQTSHWAHSWNPQQTYSPPRQRRTVSGTSRQPARFGQADVPSHLWDNSHSTISRPHSPTM